MPFDQTSGHASYLLVSNPYEVRRDGRSVSPV